MQAGSCERQSQTGPEKQLHEINPAGHHPPPIPPPELPGFRHDLPAGPAQLRRTGSADSGTAADPRQREHAHEPLARTAVPSGQIRIGPGVRPDRMRMYRRTDRIQKPAEPLPAALRTAVYLRPLPVYVAAALYRISRPGLGFIKNTNSALLSRNVNFVCLAFVTGILVPLASITSESMLLALLFTALLFYNPTVAGLVLLVFIPTVWFYYSAVRKRLHRYGVQENEAQREKARTVVETFRDMPTWRSTMPFLRCCAASTGRWTRSLRFSPEI